MIRIRNLEKSFASNRGTVHAVQGIDLDVAPSEFLVLLGPSGCGKTTTLRAVAGLERPDGGTIEIDETLVDEAGGRFVPPERRDIGMVFQSYAVWPHLNVFQNVAMPLTEGPWRVPRDEVRSRVLEALRLVRLEALESRPVTDLSGGQQQRVALARAIVRRPKVLLMDEPLSNLDARLRDAMRTEIKRLTTELGVTTLYVTHDQIEALSLGHRICVMKDGRILQQGSPEDIYNRPADVFVAQFVGDMNFIPGTVSNRGLIESPVGIVVRASQHSTALSAGEQVTLAMRPEQVQVASGPGADVVEGRLMTRLFVGDAAIWNVQVNGVPLAAKVRGSDQPAADGTVYLRLPEDQWLTFPDRAISPMPEGVGQGSAATAE